MTLSTLVAIACNALAQCTTFNLAFPGPATPALCAKAEVLLQAELPEAYTIESTRCEGEGEGA